VSHCWERWPCIWKSAGVVSKKQSILSPCDRSLECLWLPALWSPSCHIILWTDNWSTSPISHIEDRRSSRPIRHRRPRMATAMLCSSILYALPILDSCMKDRCDFLFVRYKRRCCTELVSWEDAACPLSGIKKRPLVGGWLNTSSVVISIGATAHVRYREVVRSWEGPLWEVPL